MAAVNPLQYRSYYHDSETGFYYLQSRYYDPEICRFINADSYASTGQSYLGYNTFAYCGNDPVNRTDADGEFWDTVFDIVSLGFSIADVIQNPSDPWAWAGLVGDVIDLIPFVTGVGELTKAAGAVADAANVIDDVYDTAKAVDNVVDAGQSAKERLESRRRYFQSHQCRKDALVGYGKKSILEESSRESVRKPAI